MLHAPAGDRADVRDPAAATAPQPVAPARWEWGAVAAITVVGGALLWWATARRGMGLASDAVAYLSAGDNIARGRGFGTWLEMPLTEWPLGYPVLLGGLAKVTGLSVLDAGRVLAVATSIGTGWATWRLSLSAVARPALRLGAVVVVTFAVATSGLQDKLLTDSLFTLAAVLLAMALLHVVAGGPRKWLAAAVLLAWALFLLRYQGAVAVVVGFAVLATFPASDAWRARLRRAASFGAAALVVPVLYLGPPTFRRQARSTGGPKLSEDLRAIPRTFAEWSVGRPLPNAAAIAGVAVLLALGVLVVVVARRGRRSDATSAQRSLALLGAYAAAWLVLLVALRLVVGFDIDNRTLNLLFPVVLVFGFGVIDGLGSRRLVAVLGVAAGVWCLVVAATGVRSLAEVRDAGSGYASAAYDPIYAELRATDVRSLVPAGCDLRTNDYNALYLAGIEAGPLPAPGAATAGDTPLCVVWIHDPPDAAPPAQPVDDLARDRHLVPSHDGSTFTVYVPAR